jgi:hypothetical protein
MMEKSSQPDRYIGIKPEDVDITAGPVGIDMRPKNIESDLEITAEELIILEKIPAGKTILLNVGDNKTEILSLIQKGFLRSASKLNDPKSQFWHVTRLK